MNKTACFTGHRPDKLNGYNPNENLEIIRSLREIIIDHIENKNVETFVSGMALGIDTWAARIVLKLKDTYPNIKLISAVPCAKQYSRWRNDDKIIWQNIIDRADDVHYVSNAPYTNWCMQVRNEYMVNTSDYVIAVWDGSNGGTGNCVKYAKNKNVEITQLHPKTLEIS